MYIAKFTRNQKDESSSLPSGGVQSLLEEADADVLILLDSCHSAITTVGASYKTTGGVKEVIAACGYETIAPGVSPHSFTKSLAEVLALASKEGPISVGEVHSQVLTRLKCWVPSLKFDKEGQFEDAKGDLVVDRKYRPTPVYSIIANQIHDEALCFTLPTPLRNSFLVPQPQAPSSAIWTLMKK
jgi:hypothetical protein